VKRYEGLFILDLTGKEEGFNDAVDRVKAIIAESGAKVETVQKMDKKTFARITDKNLQGGYYVNFIFELAPAAVAGLHAKFKLIDEVYRVTIVHSTTPQPAQ
jgi:ribosomal protein S6